MTHLVVGHGQLGSAVAANLGSDTYRAATVPWTDHQAARRSLEEQVTSFLQSDSPEAVLWCAGSGVVGTPERLLWKERELLDVVLNTIDRSRRKPRQLFLASSAGGINALNEGMCDEDAPPSPISDYGRSKLEQERLVKAWAAATGVPTLIGRISNLYGPRQDLAKRQGFVSRLLAGMARQEPIIFTVSAGTVRDFLYADDVGRWLAAWATSFAEPTGQGRIKILAAGRSLTLANVVTIASHVTRRPARALFATDPRSDQPLNVRFRSRSSLAGEPLLRSRTVEHGIWRTWQQLITAAFRPEPRFREAAS